MYPSIQAKIWGNMGRVSELLDLILDGFIKVRSFFLLFLPIVFSTANNFFREVLPEVWDRCKRK